MKCPLDAAAEEAKKPKKPKAVLYLKAPLLVSYLEMEEHLPSELIPEVEFVWKTKECKTWAELMELQHDPDFLTPFPDPHVEYVDGIRMGTKKRWIPTIGTATEQLLARDLLDRGILELRMEKA